MREGIFEVTVVNMRGGVFPEGEFDGKHYVRATSGSEYMVKIAIHRDALGNFPYPHAVCELVIDGVSVDRGSYLELGPACVMYNYYTRGFQINCDSLKAFTFADATATTGGATNVANAKVGTIQLFFYEATRREISANPALTTFAPRQASNIPTSPDSKKFWQQPSLATSPGRDIQQQFTLAHYRKLRQIPDFTVELRYHSEAMFDILEQLHNQRIAPPVPAPAQVPVHIDLSAEPEQAPVAAPAVPPVVVDLLEEEQDAGAEPVVKVERKRKLGDEGNDRETAIDVDLAD